jgi:RND family efflux transporter MFP subunit
MALLSPTADVGGFARASGEMERLERETARAERLYAAGAIPQKRLQDTRLELEIARAEVAAMGGRAAGEFGLALRAPISGIVAERKFVPGGRVEAGEPLFLIVDSRTVWLRVHVPPGGATGLARGATASFRAEGTDRTYTSASLVAVGRVLDERTRTVAVTFAVDNADGALKVGQFVQAAVPVGGAVRGVAVPNEAVIDDGGIPVAYVQVSGETFERRILTLGSSDGIHTQVVDGIRPGEMVVVEGAYQVRLASMSGESFSGGHAH